MAKVNKVNKKSDLEQKIRNNPVYSAAAKPVIRGVAAAKKAGTKVVKKLEKVYEEPLRGAKKYKKNVKLFWDTLGK